MKKNLLFVLFISLAFYSCSSNDEDLQEITNINNQELMPEKILKSIIGLDQNEPIASYDYYQLFAYNNQGKLIKVTRDYFNFIYPIYVNLEYNGNTITVENRSDDTSVIFPKNSVIYTVNNNGKIKEKYVTVPNGGYIYAVKKYYYEYNADGRLYQIKLTYPNITPGTPYYFELDDFERVDTFFYSGDNLNKIVSQSLKDYKSHSNIRTETEFSDYDNAKNPFKRLGLLDSYFYRSLSENNYRKLKTFYYDENNVQSLSSVSSWTFSYDHNNNIILGF